MGKAPAFQFYVRDWLSDPSLQAASASSRGIWINALCYMWEAPVRGELKASVGALARLLNATPKEFDLFLSEAQSLGFASVTCNADVTDCNSDVTVRNRRMYREQQERNKTNKRVQKHRKKKAAEEACNAKVTVPSSSSSSSSGTKVPSFCPEPRKAPGPQPFIKIPLKDGSEYGVATTDICGWADSYQALDQADVEQCLRDMREWCISNPAKRKTKKGARSFITSWLKRENDERKKAAAAGAKPAPPGSNLWDVEL